MNEVYYSGSIQRNTYAYEDKPDHLWALLKEKFPWVKQEQYFSISDPAMHEVLNEPVMTACLPYPQCTILAGEGVSLAARKFCMESVTSFLRVYTLVKEDRPMWLPEGANLLFVGENRQEFGRPFNPLASTFKDYYFGGNPELIESHFNLPARRGTYDTWYGATVKDNQVLRVKQYCYDEQGIFSDWDVAFIALCKRDRPQDQE
jgi:hypothetical protein